MAPWHAGTKWIPIFLLKSPGKQGGEWPFEWPFGVACPRCAALPRAMGLMKTKALARGRLRVKEVRSCQQRL